MSVSFVGQSGINSGTAIPYQRVMEPSQLGMFLHLEQAELLRIRRYHEHWRFYVGQHWAFTREGGEPLVTLNYARTLVDKAASWLVGAGMTVAVPQVFQHHTLPILEEVWEYNNRDQLLYNMALLGGVTGDVFALVTYAEPTDQARRVNPHTQGQIRIQLLNSEQVFPQWDPLNTDVLTSVRIETIYYDDRQQSMESSSDNQAKQLHTRRYTQIITPTHIIEQYQGQEPTSKENPLGEIPLIHIKNHPLPGEYYGLADMDSILDLNRELNEKATDISDIVNYHSAPVTVVTGAKVKQLERSSRNIWSGLPSEAKVFNLTLDSDLSAAIAYWKLIKQSMFEIASIPEGSLGQTQPISNTSGVALHTQYQPLVEKTARKRAFYEPGIAQINYFILRIKEVADNSFIMPTDLCKNCGGRIVEFAQPDGSVEKKCYHVNPQTFKFLSPDEVKVKYVRQHSFGSEVSEAPFSQVMKEHQKYAPSYWDPEKTRPAEEVAAEHAQAMHDAQLTQTAMSGGNAEGQAPPEKPAEQPVVPPKLPVAAMELPAEPETITLQRVLLDPTTGEQIPQEKEVITVVPMECTRHEYCNPYATTVTLNDTVPKDKQLQANLFQVYQTNGWVSKSWVRRQLPEIDNVEKIEEEIEEERAETPVQAKVPQGKQQATTKEQDAGQGSLDRTVGPPFGSNIPGG